MTKPKLKDPATIAKILAMLMLGNTLETSSAAAGVAPRTFRTWVSEDEDLQEQVMEAQATFESGHVANIDRIAKGSTNQSLAASQWMLERTNPAVWGRSTRNDLFTRDQQVRELAEELRRDGVEITDAQLFKELAQLEKKALPSGKKT